MVLKNPVKCQSFSVRNTRIYDRRLHMCIDLTLPVTGNGVVDRLARNPETKGKCLCGMTFLTISNNLGSLGGGQSAVSGHVK